MNLFFKNILVFFGLFFIIIVLTVLAGIWRIRKIPLPSYPEKETLFLGDSQIYGGIRNKVIQGSINFGQGGDSYLQALTRLKILHKTNPQLKAVFLGLSPYTFAPNADTIIYSPSNMARNVPLYSPHLDCTGYKYFLKGGKGKFLQLLMIKSYRNIFLPRNRLFRKWNIENDTVFQGKVQDKAPKIPGMPPGSMANKKQEVVDGNLEQIQCGRKIIEYCRQENLKIIGLIMPTYKVRNFFDIEYFYQILHREFSDLDLWDYLDDFSAEEFADQMHLNEDGAQRLSRQLNDRLHPSAH